MWPPITLLAVATSISVSLYSFYLLTLVLFDLRKRPDVDPPCDEHPVVTVQIPVYNEALVQRALKHVAALDYPRDRLQIQILDDSTDPAILALERRLVARYRRRGFDVALVHREIPVRTRSELGDPFVPRPEVAKLSSVGFHGVMADYYWHQAVQIVGASMLPED